MHPQRQVPAAEITPALDKLHARLMAGNLDGALVTQIHDFLDIDPDLVNRVYPPFAHTHPAVSFTEPCHCGRQIPTDRVAYCSDRCRNGDRGE
jgi:hypothetical protein